MECHFPTRMGYRESEGEREWRDLGNGEKLEIVKIGSVLD